MLIDDRKIPIIKKKQNIQGEIDLFNKYTLTTIHSMLQTAKRPLIIAGNGIKISHCKEKFHSFLKKYNIPVVVSFHGTDVIEYTNPLFFGKVGFIGDRTGNFTIQNCDLLLCFGCRMSQGIIGYRSEWFAREARIIYIDNDVNELEKNNLHYDVKLNIDINDFFDNYNYQSYDYSEWIKKCNIWKNKWMYELPHINYENSFNQLNPYYVLNYLFDKSPNNKIVISSSGSIITNVWHMIKIKPGDNFVISSQGDMGFELPASIGCAIANKDKMIIPIMGEGALQLNIQELQTIIHHNLHIKILIFNNNTHGATKMTQTNFFKNLFGVNSETGLSFPNTEKISNAYGIKYLKVNTYEEVHSTIDKFLQHDGPVLCEIFSCIQSRYPRLNAVKNEDGTFTNRPFEDMDPFLPREEFNKEMIVKPI